MIAHNQTFLEIQQDQRNQADGFGSDGWTASHAWAAWLLLVVLMIVIWGDGGWPWQRRPR